jgi:CHASE2 domain-containing sensor protein/two-component sensor histidine kinase
VYRLQSTILSSLPSLAVITGLLLLRSLGAIQTLELMAFDRYLQLRPIEAADDRIVIISVTERDLSRLKSYPISDQILATTIQQVNQLQPSAIGIDIFRDFDVPPGTANLKKVIQTTPNLFLAYRYTPDQTSGVGIAAPKIATAEQQGFVDVAIDPDSKIRRVILGVSDPKTATAHISLPVQLASIYLDQRDQGIENDDQGLIINQQSYPFITPNFGAYQHLDHGADQIMFNPRNHATTFRQFSLADVQQGKLQPRDIQGKVVLFGLTATSIKDVVSSMSVRDRPDGQVNGIEFQAHATSQLISAVLDRRSLIRSIGDGPEVIWIIGCGVAGIILGRVGKKPLLTFAGIVLGLGLIVAISYGLLIYGWWIPFVPASLAFFANASGFVAAQLYQRDRDLQLRLNDRQQLLEQTFTAIHNGPLQDLAALTRQIQDTPAPEIVLPVIATQLQTINQQLRGVFESGRIELTANQQLLYLGDDQPLDLQQPLHELLQQVYNDTCRRELSGLAAIKIKVIQFDPIDSPRLTIEHKRNLCRFLEEALRNVGNHAQSATKLWVYCGEQNRKHIISIKDNGCGCITAYKSGSGSQHAKKLAKQLRGKFQRSANQPQGTICQLTW